MSMHLLGPAYNNIGRTVKKRTTKQIRAQTEHEAWLRKQNIHPDQLSARRKPAGKFTQTVKCHQPGLECSNNFDVGGFKNSVFDSAWKKTYDHDPEMAHREASALKQAEALKNHIAPAYNKGAYQLITPGSYIHGLGRKL